jgi:hypothetical protein
MELEVKLTMAPDGEVLVIGWLRMVKYWSSDGKVLAPDGEVLLNGHQMVKY